MEVKTWRKILSIKEKTQPSLGTCLWDISSLGGSPQLHHERKPDTKLMTQRALSSPSASETYLAHSPELFAQAKSDCVSSRSHRALLKMKSLR